MNLPQTQELISEFIESTVHFQRSDWDKWINDLLLKRTPYPAPVTQRTDLQGVLNDTYEILYIRGIDTTIFWQIVSEKLLMHINIIKQSSKKSESDQVINQLLHLIQDIKPEYLKTLVRDLVFDRKLYLDDHYLGWLKTWYFILGIYLGYRSKYIDFDFWSLELEEKLFQDAESPQDSLFYFITPWYFIYFNKSQYLNYFNKLINRSNASNINQIKKSFVDFLEESQKEKFRKGSFYLYSWLKDQLAMFSGLDKTNLNDKIKDFLLNHLESNLNDSYNKISFIIICSGYRIIHPELFFKCLPKLSNENIKTMYYDSINYYLNSSNDLLFAHREKSTDTNFINFWMSNERSELSKSNPVNDRSENLIYSIDAISMRIRFLNNDIQPSIIYKQRIYTEDTSQGYWNTAIVEEFNERFAVESNVYFLV